MRLVRLNNSHIYATAELPFVVDDGKLKLPHPERAFIEKFGKISLDRSEKRRDARERRANRAKIEKAPTAAEIQLAHEAVLKYALAKIAGQEKEVPEATAHQKRLVRQAEYDGQAPPWSEHSSYVRDRLKNGYVLAKETLVCGKYPLKPFTERWLRSPLSPALEKFVAATARAGNRARKDHEVFLASDGKSSRQRQWSKLKGLDCTYVSVLREMTSAFRVELDATFVSLAVLRRCLERMNLPCLPHIIAYSSGANGEVIHPHLWFMLPEGSAVWFSLDERCRTAPQRLLQGVVLGVTKRLKPIGADIAGATNFRDGKNPCDPKLSSFAVFNEVVYPDLADWARHVDVRGNVTTEIRETLITQSGLPRRISQPLYHAAHDFCWRRLRQAFKTPTGPLTSACRYPGADRSGLAAILLEELTAAADEIQPGAAADESKLRMLGRVADFVSRAWRPGAEHRNRGAAEDYVRGVDDPIERQAIGRDYAHHAQVVNTVWECRKAALELLATGRRLTNRAIGLLADRDPRTVSNHRAKIMDAMGCGTKDAIWCLIGGPPLPSANGEKSSLSSDNLISAPEPSMITVDDEMTFGSRDDVQSANDVTSVAVRGGPGFYSVSPTAIYAANLTHCHRTSAPAANAQSDRQQLDLNLANCSVSSDSIGHATPIASDSRGAPAAPVTETGSSESQATGLLHQAVDCRRSRPPLGSRCNARCGPRIGLGRSKIGCRRFAQSDDDPAPS